MTPHEANYIPHNLHPQMHQRDFFCADRCKLVQSRFGRNLNCHNHTQTKVVVSFENTSQVEHCEQHRAHHRYWCAVAILATSFPASSARSSRRAARARTAAPLLARSAARSARSIPFSVSELSGGASCMGTYGRMNFRGRKQPEHLIGKTNNCSVPVFRMSPERFGRAKPPRMLLRRPAALSGRLNSILRGSAIGAATLSRPSFQKFSSATRCGMSAS